MHWDGRVCIWDRAFRSGEYLSPILTVPLTTTTGTTATRNARRKKHTAYLPPTRSLISSDPRKVCRRRILANFGIHFRTRYNQISVYINRSHFIFRLKPGTCITYENGEILMFPNSGLGTMFVHTLRIFGPCKPLRKVSLMPIYFYQSIILEIEMTL